MPASIINAERTPRPHRHVVSVRIQAAPRNRIPATYANREDVVAGGLMSYGTDVADLALGEHGHDRCLVSRIKSFWHLSPLIP
jgi:hypothetical protein